MKLPSACASPGCLISWSSRRSLPFTTSTSPSSSFPRRVFLRHDTLRPRQHASPRALTYHVTTKTKTVPMLYLLLMIMISIAISPVAAFATPTTAIPDPRQLSQEDIPTEIVFYHEDDATGTHLAARATSTAMPSPFDTNLEVKALTRNCEKFFTDFLSNSTVTNCHPVSMFLEDSNSFFHSLTSAAAVSTILDTSCSASSSQCTDIMTKLATKLLKDDACGQDYRNGNQNVRSAYTDMITYEPVYAASCLKDRWGDYCFVDAVMNTSNTDDYSVYFLPLGTYYTDTSRPTCNQCLQATMNIFAQWAEVQDQPLVTSYIPSAVRVNQVCGDNFITTNVSVGVKKALVSESGSWGRTRPDLVLLGCVFGLSWFASVLGVV